MEGMARVLGAVTSILVGVFIFLLVVIFAALHLVVVEWMLGPVDDRRFVLAGGLLLGFAIAIKCLDIFSRWYGRGR